MLLFPNSTMRLSALPAALTIIIVIALALLIGKRLDLLFAGGEGVGPHASALLKETYDFSDPSRPSSSALPSVLTRGATVTTNAFTFARYTINDECTIALAENSSLTLEDGRGTHNAFTLLTGRAVAVGDCAFTTRETQINVHGTATVVHFSWLNKIVVKAIEGNVVVSQSGTTTELTSESPALQFSTLPSAIIQEETGFSLTQNDLISSFYNWSLND